MTSPGQDSWPRTLTELLAGRDLPEQSAAWAMDEIMTGNASSAQVAGFLIALRAKGETIAELTGLSGAMLGHARRFDVPSRCVDIVGTGGDRANTVNISTMAALVIAGTGLRVVKHGNRAASSACGSADLLEELGVRLDLPVDAVRELAIEVGITFCFAQVFHPSMRHVAPTRKELGVPTVFNFLGPLTNPAQPAAVAVGVADPRMAPLMAGVFAVRGVDALVFRGDDGLDELAPTSTATIWEVRAGQVRVEAFDPRELSIQRCELSALRGADAAFNADVARRVLSGERGAVRDAVTMNAAAALVADSSYVATDGSLTERMARAMARAEAAIDDGSAAAVLDRWRSAARTM